LLPASRWFLCLLATCFMIVSLYPWYLLHACFLLDASSTPDNRNLHNHRS
jgi:hypothetical protein